MSQESNLNKDVYSNNIHLHSHPPCDPPYASRFLYVSTSINPCLFLFIVQKVAYYIHYFVPLALSLSSLYLYICVCVAFIIYLGNFSISVHRDVVWI